MNEFIILLSIILSILLISKGSDWLTDSLEPLARKLKTSNIAVGLLLVSVVVSLPEVLVAVDTAIKNQREISLGVAFGSIIANIGLMTGLNSMIRPLKVTLNIILRDGIISLVIPILLLAISAGGEITRLDGLAMFLLFIPYLINIYLQEKAASKIEVLEQKKEIQAEIKFIDFGLGKLKAGFFSFGLGSLVLIIGTYIFSETLVTLVNNFGLNPLFIGFTLGAIIPSIPNIAASLKATIKGLTEVAVSETIGANVFTLLVTVGIISMISPVTIRQQWLNFDIPLMFIMSLLLVIFMMTGRKISRVEGMFLFVSYLLILFLQIILIG